MTTTEDTTALILAGEGYQLTIAPEALARRAELIIAAGAVQSVASNDDSGDAAVHVRRLAALRIEVEKCRKEIKEPVNKIGKIIDLTAREFLADVEAEENRIKKLIGNYADEVAAAKRAAELAERRAFEEARAAREAAEAAAAAAENTGKVSAIIAAKQAEKERQEALAARMEASAEVATTKIAEGVRFVVDYEIVDVRAFLTASPHLCEITVRRSDTLAWLKEWLAEDKDRDRVAEQAGGLAVAGLRVFKKPVVSSR
jgi:Na+-transporting methylmalonyl-CoA/oxaloacetate decarboxylase gamma subunit